ncbi:MAG: helix-turn-helix transcriptional regulator [Conchiformibius sp.]|nr:helix-turn-helix transcriptional regulator [Conchiformibius sp.]
MSLTIHHPRYQKLRAHVKQLRQAAGLTQKQMAQLLGVTQSHISKIENGDRYMDVLFYIDWCAACGQNAGEEIRKLAD